MRSVRTFVVVVMLLACVAGTVVARPWGDSFAEFILDEGREVSNEDEAMERLYLGCISCHDGAIGSDVSVESVSSKRGAGMSAIAKDHPVGMNYNESYTRKMGGLVSQQSLPAEIVLVNGQVTCLSCHKIKESVRRFVDSNNGSMQSSVGCTSSKEITVARWQHNLCVSCHNM
jgi:hypothetical protein